MAIKESTHWYDAEGKPAYTVIGANGNERNTTLRDARKLNLYPSVTTILGIIAKPGLERWKIDQALMAALTLPKVEDESLDAFKARALEDSQQHAKQAADLGTRIHAAVQGHFEGVAPDESMWPYVKGVIDALNEAYGNREWIPEASFVDPEGYGGKVDLHCPGIVLDIKTKEFEETEGLKAWDEQIMQCKAYAQGLRMTDARTGNVFVSVSNPGLVAIVEHPRGNHLERFMCLLKYWQLTKNYRPEAAQ